MNNIIDPTVLYEPFNSLALDDLKDQVDNILYNGITIQCCENTNNNILLQAESCIKRGEYKSIYLLKQVVISNTVYDSQNYILKVRFTQNNPEYWENEKQVFPNQGIIPLNMSEGKRYNLIDGEIKKYFATILPTKIYTLLITEKYIVDFIIQEKMMMSLDTLRKNTKISLDTGLAIMHKMLIIANTFIQKGYTFTNFSPSSVMMKLVDNKVILKLVNTSFLQREEMISVKNNMKLLSTASVAQLRGENIASNINMLWNILFTTLDIFHSNSFIDDIKQCCNEDDFYCIRDKLITNRMQEIQYYSTHTDEIFGDFIVEILDAGNINKIIEMTKITDESEQNLRDAFIQVITKKVTFNKSDMSYKSEIAKFIPSCTDIQDFMDDGLNPFSKSKSSVRSSVTMPSGFMDDGLSPFSKSRSSAKSSVTMPSGFMDDDDDFSSVIEDNDGSFRSISTNNDNFSSVIEDNDGSFRSAFSENESDSSYTKLSSTLRTQLSEDEDIDVFDNTNSLKLPSFSIQESDNSMKFSPPINMPSIFMDKDNSSTKSYTNNTNRLSRMLPSNKSISEIKSYPMTITQNEFYKLNNRMTSLENKVDKQYDQIQNQLNKIIDNFEY